MSQVIWGLSKLVNDPTTTLFQELRHRVFRAHSSRSTEDSEEATAANNEVNPPEHNDAAISPKPSYSKGKPRIIEMKSKSTQVGNGMYKRHHASIQCQRSQHMKTCKTTSIPHVSRLDSSTGEAHVVDKKDAAINSLNPDVCKSHREVLWTLQRWRLREPEANHESNNILNQLKTILMRIAKAFQMEKIQNIPPYRPPEKQFMRLYKCESLDLIKTRENQGRRKSKTEDRQCGTMVAAGT
ncbi:uncharacterized protein LOC142972687 [Anticarsia gemmatalis]|uniref:uncharacterized protein LOC142972687 n=1 Tax=Anticarsia gemmatalis TaxID=129554 RepID=UPI003F758985